MDLQTRIVLCWLTTLMLSTYVMSDIIINTPNQFSNSFCHNILYIGGSCSGSSISQPTCTLNECDDLTQNEELTNKYTEFVSSQQERLDKYRDEYSFLPFKDTVLIANAFFVTVPKAIFTMTKLTDVQITQSKLREINLNDFLTLPILKKINLSNNTIIVIKSNEESEMNSTVSDIDLSFNFVEVIPNNFVKRFNLLENLNMSHNMISSIDNNAFEGTPQLKTLDLSFNRLKEVGNIFSYQARPIDANEITPGNLEKLSKVLLDDNLIVTIDFTEVFKTSISELSIGGNKISCDQLAQVKFDSELAEKFNSIVTAKNLVYIRDGSLNGITCQKTEGGIFITSDYPSSNTIILIASLKNELENINKRMDFLAEGIMNLFGSVNRQVKEIKKSLPAKSDLE